MKLTKVLLFTNSNQQFSSLEKSQLVNEFVALLQQWGLQPTVILGEDGDELLRSSKVLQFCDIGFSRKTNLFSALADCPESLDGPCFLADLSQLPQKAYYSFMTQEYHKEQANIDSHLIRLIAEGEIVQPHILSQNGAFWIKKNFEKLQYWQAYDFSWKSFYLSTTLDFTNSP